MGLERSVPFTGAPPTWAAIGTQLVAEGLSVRIRMIDGLPAFPDEVPAEGWQELRLSTPAGMMTLRQHPERLAVIVWGNADENLQRECEQVLAACARAIHSPA